MIAEMGPCMTDDIGNGACWNEEELKNKGSRPCDILFHCPMGRTTGQWSKIWMVRNKAKSQDLTSRGFNLRFTAKSLV